MSDLHRPKKIFKFLIWGGWYGSRNIGDTAILLGLKRLIEKVNKKNHLYIRALSTDIDYTSTNGLTGVKALLKKDIFRISSWFRILKIFKSVDKIIISGGTPIFDHSHLIRSLYFFLPIIFRKPFILFGAGVKKINNLYGRKYIPWTLNKADYKSVRDKGSLQVLKELGVKNVNLTADSAFFAEPSSTKNLDKVLKQHKINISDKILVIAPRLMSENKKRLYLEEDMDKKLITKTPKMIANVLNKIASKFDKIVFMAMHFYGPDSDVPLIKQIYRTTKAINKVFINEELRPEIAIALFKNADTVLGMRLHSVLLSASMSTPVVGIAYEKKVKDLFSRLNLKNNFVDLFNFTEKDLLDKLERAIKNHDEIRDHLDNRVSELRKLIYKDSRDVLNINS